MCTVGRLLLAENLTRQGQRKMQTCCFAQMQGFFILVSTVENECCGKNQNKTKQPGGSVVYASPPCGQ